MPPTLEIVWPANVFLKLAIVPKSRQGLAGLRMCEAIPKLVVRAFEFSLKRQVVWLLSEGPGSSGVRL